MENVTEQTMITDYTDQLELISGANKALADAAAAIKKARGVYGTIRKAFPGRAKEANKILKGIDAADSKIWDSTILSSALTNDIKNCEEQEKAEPDLPGMMGLR